MKCAIGKWAYYCFCVYWTWTFSSSYSMGGTWGWDKPWVLWNPCTERGPCEVTWWKCNILDGLLYLSKWDTKTFTTFFISLSCLRYGKQTMSGIIKDGLSAISRYYLNNFQDGARQASYLVLLTIHALPLFWRETENARLFNCWRFDISSGIFPGRYWPYQWPLYCEQKWSLSFPSKRIWIPLRKRSLSLNMELWICNDYWLT